MNKICITGANGFIGKPLMDALIKSGKFVRGFIRNDCQLLKSNNYENIIVGDITQNINWANYLQGFDCLIHCAGRAHIMNDNDGSIYFNVNTLATKNLAEHAANAGIKRLIFLSTIKVNGESTKEKLNNNDDKSIFKYSDVPNPQDFYATSKLEAEQILLNISKNTELEVVIVRLPLVYGREVKGNLLRLKKLIYSNLPIPLGLIKNQRSLIGMDNLIDLLTKCINHPNAAGKIFLASDDEHLSTPDLIRCMASAMGKPTRIFPIPLFILKLFAKILGKQNEIDRLLGSLKVDNTYTKKVLNWKPPYTVFEGIKKMVMEK